MKIPLSLCLSAAVATAVLAGCGRKDDAKGAPEGQPYVEESATPAPAATQPETPSILVEIDRAKAAALGVSVSQVEAALVKAFGAEQVATADLGNNAGQPKLRITPRAGHRGVEVGEIKVQSNDGIAVPLSSLIVATESSTAQARTNPDAEFLKQMERAAPPAVPAKPPAASDERASYEAWFQKHNLDLNDPQMLSGDADGDGVSNRDEFLAGTNPRDPISKPGGGPAAAATHAPLRFREYKENPVPLVLQSVSGTQAVIVRNDGGETQTVRTGDTVKGFALRVTKISERPDRDKDGNAVDRSQVLLEDATTKERVTLVKGLPAKTSANYAVIASEDGATSVKVHAGEVFLWPGHPSVSYRVVDLGPDQITLQEQASKKLWTIPRQ